MLFQAPRSADAQIRVMAPQQLVAHFDASKGRIEGSTATFGAPYYGERLLGRLVYGETKGKHHCTDEDYDLPAVDMVTNNGRQQVALLQIALVRRGTCSFVTKVKAARKKGAHAVIIVDNEESNLSAHEIQKTIVGNDGWGDSIDIPSILVAKEDGNPLIEAAKNLNQEVIIELAWDIPTNHVVTLDLWMSSASRESQHFLQDFSAKRKLLNEKVKFVPHYHVFSMTQPDYNDLCLDSKAELCAEDPDASGPVTGKDVLEEDVRQLCIHELTKVSREDRVQNPMGTHKVEYAEKYWNYVEQLPDACPLDASTPASRFGKACSETLMRKVRIDVDQVERCALVNTTDYLLKERKYIAWSPRALRINGWRFVGALDADLVTRAICAGFVVQPSSCKRLVQPMKVLQETKGIQQDGIGFGTLAFALFGVGLLAFGLLLLYRRSLTKHIHTALREEVMLEVQAQMDSYRQMPC